MDDALLSEKLPTTFVGVAPVCEQMLGKLQRDRFQRSLKLGALVALSGRNLDRERASLPVAGEVQLARKASPAVAQGFIFGVYYPLFASSSLTWVRAPAACW